MISTIGVELEGGWTQSAMVDLNDAGWVVTGDGSVSVACCSVGEVQSPAFNNTETGWVSFKEWLRTCYPSRVNNSCGYHVHVGLLNLEEYMRLTNHFFNKWFLKRMEDFEKRLPDKYKYVFNYRRTGRNTYCKAAFRPSEQIHRRDKYDCRYTQLNYCWGLHNTMECRLAPMFDTPLWAIRYTKYLVRTMDLYLEQYKPDPDITWKQKIEEEEQGKESVLECVFK